MFYSQVIIDEFQGCDLGGFDQEYQATLMFMEMFPAEMNAISFYCWHYCSLEYTRYAVCSIFGAREELDQIVQVIFPFLVWIRDGGAEWKQTSQSGELLAASNGYYVVEDDDDDVPF